MPADFIGECTIPLTSLMDGRRHEYAVPLIDPEGIHKDEGILLPKGCELCFQASLES